MSGCSACSSSSVCTTCFPVTISPTINVMNVRQVVQHALLQAVVLLVSQDTRFLPENVLSRVIQDALPVIRQPENVTHVNPAILKTA